MEFGNEVLELRMREIHFGWVSVAAWAFLSVKKQISIRQIVAMIRVV